MPIHTSPVGQSKTLLNVWRFDPEMGRVDHWLERKVLDSSDPRIVVVGCARCGRAFGLDTYRHEVPWDAPLSAVREAIHRDHEAPRATLEE